MLKLEVLQENFFLVEVSHEIISQGKRKVTVLTLRNMISQNWRKILDVFLSVCVD